MRSSLLLVGVVCAVSLVAVVAVATNVTRAAGSVPSVIQHVTRANCNDDRNVRDPCIVLDTPVIASSVALATAARNNARGTKSLGPIRDIFGSRLTQYYMQEARVAGPLHSLLIPSTMGCGTAWGGRLSCKEDNSRVQISDGPPFLPVAGSSAARARLERAETMVQFLPVTPRKFSSAVEHRPDKAGVVGSNPSASTIFIHP